MRIIAGPCQHESYEQSLEIAKHCKKWCDHFGFEYYFKASYDKANRTSMHSPRGIGLKETLLLSATFLAAANANSFDLPTIKLRKLNLGSIGE